jgi:hypothetical protein
VYANERFTASNYINLSIFFFFFFVFYIYQLKY